MRLNGDDYGLYVNVEQPDDVFLERWFPTTQHLYEGQYGNDVTRGRAFDYEVDEGPEDESELNRDSQPGAHTRRRIPLGPHARRCDRRTEPRCHSEHHREGEYSQLARCPSGEIRRFLEDGDEVIMRASCAREGFVSIGFGECRGTILPELTSRTDR